jgi:hypothetical protein
MAYFATEVRDCLDHPTLRWRRGAGFRGKGCGFNG